MSGVPAIPWVDAVRTAGSGPELLGFLRRRLTSPYEEGPPLDDRRGEGPEEIFEAIARAHQAFRLQLEETIIAFFKSDEASPEDASARPLIRGLLDLVEHLALSGVFTPLRAWLERHEQALATEPEAVLGRATLGALATSQVPGIAELRDFWRSLLRSSPRPWRPRAFIGLRLQDAEAAASEIPWLMQYAKDEGQDAGPLLHGMWLQPGGREAICDWFRKNGTGVVAADVRSALRRRLPVTEWDKIPRTEPKRCLRSVSRGAALAQGGTQPWD